MADVAEAQARDTVWRSTPPTSSSTAADRNRQSLEESTRHTHVNVVGTSAAGRAQRHGKLPRRIVCPPAAWRLGEDAWSATADRSTGQRTSATTDTAQWDFPGHPLPMKASVTFPAP